MYCQSMRSIIGLFNYFDYHLMYYTNFTYKVRLIDIVFHSMNEFIHNDVITFTKNNYLL